MEIITMQKRANPKTWLLNILWWTIKNILEELEIIHISSSVELGMSAVKQINRISKVNLNLIFDLNDFILLCCVSVIIFRQHLFFALISSIS